MARRIALQNKFAACALLVLGQGAFAAQPPTAGSQIQQIPPAPVAPRPAPELHVQPGGTNPAPAAGNLKFVVQRLHVTGAHVLSEADLIALTGFKPGSELTLAELHHMAATITERYHQLGYFVAQAYLPAQDIEHGVVTIAVLEGRYGKVVLRNHTNLSDGLAKHLLGSLRSGDPVASGPLESSLLLLSDLPGVQVKSTLVPGESVGASNLLVDVAPGPRVTGSVDADNEGNRYTGPNRVGATVNANDLTGHGDVLTVRGLTSGDGLDYGRASYQMQFGKAKVGVAYADLKYWLGKDFTSLQAHGTAQVASLYGSYPLLRSRNTNLYALFELDSKTFQDDADAVATHTDKKARTWTTSLIGNHQDGLGGGGSNSYGLAWTFGDLEIQSPAALAADAAGARSSGHYNKLAFDAARLQHVTRTISLYAAVHGQVADHNLDISEKMELGGAYAVRAYPEGEAYADQGYVVTLEARKLLPRFWTRMPGQVQLVGFVDSGTVTLDKDAYAAGPNRRTLSGAGIGLDWIDNNDFSVKAYYAHKLGDAVATSAPDASGRFWIQVVKYF